jgi:hypothetical protein
MIQQEILSISMRPPTGPGIMPRELNLIPVQMMVLKTKRLWILSEPRLFVQAVTMVVQPVPYTLGRSALQVLFRPSQGHQMSLSIHPSAV